MAASICVSLIWMAFHSWAFTNGIDAENPKFQLLSVPILNCWVCPPMFIDTVWSLMVRWYAPEKSMLGNTLARVSRLL